MENETTSANSQEVAAPETSTSSVAESGAEQAAASQESTQQAQTVEVAKPRQDSATNAAFAQMRRDAENAKRENEMLLNSLKQYGYQGSASDIADQLIAQRTGRDINAVKAEREANERINSMQSQLVNQNHALVNELSKRMMEDDLKKIQAIDPSVKSLNDLGEEYVQLIGNGLDAELAYHTIKAKEKAHLKPVPKDLGPIGSTTQEKDFYTKDEVDQLTDKQLDDPKIWERVRKSMLKW